MSNNLIEEDDENQIKLCPEDVCERASILYFDGFGFPGPNDFIDDKFALAQLNSDIDLDLSFLRMATGSNNLEIETFGNIKFITIYWHEYSLHKNILNILLQLGIKFTTTNKFKTQFDPKIDQEYTKEVEELKFIEKYYKLIDELDLVHKEGFRIICNEGDQAFLSEWNWITREGKQFSNDLRSYLNLPLINPNSKENYFNSQLFKKCEILTLQTTEFESETDSDDEKCIVCFDRYPETIVDPCGHCVVCFLCSEQLKQSNHRDKCIMCRGKINKIINMNDNQEKNVYL